MDATPGRSPHGGGRSHDRPPTWRRPIHLMTLLPVVLGLSITIVLTITARVSYEHTEQHLTGLQTSLSGQVLQTTLFGVSSDLERVVGLSAESPDPAGTFRNAVGPLVAPTGPFASARLIAMDPKPTVISSLGAAPLRDATAAPAVHLYDQAARTSSLVTTRAVAGRAQRFGFLVSARGTSGTYVVAVSESLPANRRLVIPASSPESVLNIAAYYGLHPSTASLVESNDAHLPIEGPHATVTVPFGNNHLTLVASAKTSLSGTWSRLLPWIILVVGLLLTLILAVFTEWLARRRAHAEATATATEGLYEEQRSVARLLQLALLPKTLPRIEGTDLAARYLPASNTVDIGGDWYSVIATGEHTYAFVVGDVSGHGIEAAIVMAPLRFTIRSLARQGLPPAEILAWANREISVVEDHRIATVLVGTVDATHRRLTLASAGHPPPVVAAEGRCAPLEVVPGPPLGVAGAVYTEQTFELLPGSTLVAFTDGLVERRDQSVDAGLERLRAAVAAAGPVEASAVLDLVLDAIGGDTDDDTAVLAIRQAPVPAAGAMAPSAGSADAGD